MGEKANGNFKEPSLQDFFKNTDDSNRTADIKKIIALRLQGYV